MDKFHDRIPDPGNRSDDQKDDPDKMHEDDNVSKNNENHCTIIVSNY